jgi:DNA transposition AAA+ family ATPase
MRKPFMKRRTIATEDLVRKIQEARDGGMKALDIMRKFNAAEQIVYKWTKNARLVRPHA